jgi:hypothetical protein
LKIFSTRISVSVHPRGSSHLPAVTLRLTPVGTAATVTHPFPDNHRFMAFIRFHPLHGPVLPGLTQGPDPYDE